MQELFIFRKNFKTNNLDYTNRGYLVDKKENVIVNNIALLIVDVQNALIDLHPYNDQKVIQNIKKLILTARNNGIEIIYIRHNDGKGTELESGTKGWQIYEDIAPQSNEKVFNKQYNSAFFKTGLKKYLDNQEINTIILVGLQTEYCLDATCKSAFEHEYKIIIPEDTNTTFDNEYLAGEKIYEFYNKKIWNNRFANVISVKDVIEILQKNKSH